MVLEFASATGRRAAHRLYGTGLVPAVGYGAEVTGLSNPELARVQAIGLRTVTPGSRALPSWQIRARRRYLHRPHCVGGFRPICKWDLVRPTWVQYSVPARRYGRCVG